MGGFLNSPHGDWNWTKTGVPKPNKSRQRKRLTVGQKNALDLIIQGKNDRQVAELVGVSRQTVWELT